MVLKEKKYFFVCEYQYLSASMFYHYEKKCQNIFSGLRKRGLIAPSSLEGGGKTCLQLHL
jgi:hypothetical protein